MSTGEAAHPCSCNINGYLVFTRKANTQLSLSHLVVLGLMWTLGSMISLDSPPAGYHISLGIACTRLKMPEQYTGIPIHVHVYW